MVGDPGAGRVRAAVIQEILDALVQDREHLRAHHRDQRQVAGHDVLETVEDRLRLPRVEQPGRLVQTAVDVGIRVVREVQAAGLERAARGGDT